MTYEEAVRVACGRRHIDPSLIEWYVQALARTLSHRALMDEEIDDDEISVLDSQVARYVLRNPPVVLTAHRMSMLTDHDNPFIPKGS